MSGLCDECGAMWQRCHCGANGEAHREVARLAVENRAALARIATLERELAAVTAERDAHAASLRMERASLDTVRGQRDDAMERVTAVESERDALGAERVMFCAVVDSLTAERDALLEQWLVLRNRWMAPTPPTGTKP